MRFNTPLNRAIVCLLSCLFSQRGLASTLFGGDLGVSISSGRGITEINRRLGDSRLLNLGSKHGIAPQASLSALHIFEKYPLMVEATCFINRDFVSATGLSSQVQSGILQKGFEFTMMKDFSDISRVRSVVSRIGLSNLDADIGAGLIVGFSSLTHDLDLYSQIDSLSVSYNTSQTRLQSGLQTLFGYRMIKNLHFLFSAKSLYTWPTQTNLNVRQFVVAGQDVSQSAKADGVQKLAPESFFRNIVTLSARIKID